MISKASLLSIIAAAGTAVSLSSCATAKGPLVNQGGRQVYKGHPIAVRVVGNYIDEDSPLEYAVRFRNVGNQVLSFDYTLADAPNVPHVDRNGPNSGFVPNLYPGAEIEVPNPLKRKTVYITLGTVTYGKYASEELERMYKSDTSLAAASIPLQ